MNPYLLVKRPDRRLALILTGLLALLFLAFGLTSGQAPMAVFLATVPFALLMGLYLLASDAPFMTALTRWEDTRRAYQTLWLPGILWLLYLAYAGQAGRFSPGDALVGAVFLGLPTLLVANRRRLRGLARPLLCLAVLALPLGLWQVMGWRGGGRWPPGGSEAALRAGAWLLAATLLFLPGWTRRERRDICLLGAVLFVWYSVEFDAVPSLSLPPQHGLIGYFHLAAIGLFLRVPDGARGPGCRDGAGYGGWRYGHAEPVAGREARATGNLTAASGRL